VNKDNNNMELCEDYKKKLEYYLNHDISKEYAIEICSKKLEKQKRGIQEEDVE